MEGAFERLLHDQAAPMFRADPRVEEARVGHPTEREPREFAMLTTWRDTAGLRAYAGPDWMRPRITPPERDLLEEASVHHFHFRAEPPEGLDARVRTLEAMLGLGSADGRRSAVPSDVLRVDPRRGIAFVDGVRHELPPQELALLAALAARPGEPVTAGELASVLWDDGTCVTPEDVRRVVYRLRRRIRDADRARPLIRNRRGFGYVIDP